MPTYTKDPTAIIKARRRTKFTPTGTSNVITALTDASDATYVKAALPNRPVDIKVARPDMGAGEALGERFVSVCPFVRSKQPGTKPVTVAASVYSVRVSTQKKRVHEGVALVLKYDATIDDYEVAAQDGQLLVPGYGVEWKFPLGGTDSDSLPNTKIIAPALTFRDPHTASGNRALRYEAGLKVYSTSAAYMDSADEPSTTVTTTQYPTLEATVKQIVESWQVPTDLPPFCCDITVWCAVYAGTWGSLGPSVEPLFEILVPVTIDEYIDGTSYSTLAIEAEPPVPLPNDTYTVYWKASRDHPSGTPNWTLWRYRTFTVNVANPNVPTLAVAKSDSEQSVSVTVTASSAAGYDSDKYEVQVQRQVDGLWRDVRGLIDVPIAVGSAELVGYDYEADRAITNTYRARVSAWHTADEIRRYSAWDEDTETGPAVAGWNLKAVESAAANWLDVPIATAPGEQAQEAAAVFSPLDRDRPVVVADTVGGAGGALEITAVGSTAVAGLEALRTYGGLIYLETPFGDEKYIRITEAAWVRLGTKDTPRRAATLSYVEVGSGLRSAVE